MKLNQLLIGIKGYKIFNDDKDLEIKNIVINSSEVEQGSLFVCLRGENKDGHNYVNQAYDNGAKAIVTEKYFPKLNLVQIVTDDCRKLYAKMMASFYNNPQKNLKIIGIVGTNGKTSTANIIYNLLKMAGKRVAVIGTNGICYNDVKLPATLTTPDPDQLYSLLSDFQTNGIEYVVMEVSAHAIWLKKTQPIYFEALVFTNCTHDHLDYFTDFAGYRSVKKSIFNKNCKFFVVNVDDPLGHEIYTENPKKTITYGIYTPSDVFAIDIKESQTELKFVMNMFDMVYNIGCNLLGEFNVYNLLAGCCVLFLCGIKIEKTVQYISNLAPISGRMEMIGEYNGGKIFIDYAHTPDGLNKSLSFVSSTTKGDTYCLFGCGGNRDSKKRYKMGKIAGDIADFVIITSDNPRYEAPEQIIAEIERGIITVSLDYITIEDRKNAILYGIKHLQKNDSLLIAGKGAEEYQEVKGEKIEFSDKATVLDIISKLKSSKA